MAENLNYMGTAPDTIGWCYENNPDSCAKYGRLYDWNTAMAGSSSSDANPSGVKGICPNGWHLPSDAEWTALIEILGEDTAGTALKSHVGWNNNGNGTNSSGFSALPGGRRSDSGGFSNIGSHGNWWTATEDDVTDAKARVMSYNTNDVGNSWSEKTYGYSVRCVMK